MAISLHTMSLKHRRNPADDLSNIIKQNARFVYSVCYRELRDRTLAEDAAQEVFVVLARKISHLHAGPSLSAWLFLTARNVSRTIARNEQHRRSYEVSSDDNLITNDKTWQPIDTCLNEAISRLNAKDREVILMRFFEQYSHKEIGDLLRISESAAERRTARALERLRKIIEAHRIIISIPIFAALLEKNSLMHVPETCIHKLSCIPVQPFTSRLPIGLLGWGLAVGLLTVLLLKSPMNSEQNRNQLLQMIMGLGVHAHTIPQSVNVKDLPLKPSDLIHYPADFGRLNLELATHFNDLGPIFRFENGVLTIYKISAIPDYYATMNSYKIMKDRKKLDGVVWGNLTKDILPLYNKTTLAINNNIRQLKLISTQYTAALTDEAGNVLWSIQYPVPDYILCIDKNRNAVLTDRNGKLEWSGTLPSKQMGTPSGEERDAFVRCKVPEYGLEYYSDHSHSIVLKDLSGRVLWSGYGINNGGLEVHSPELESCSIWGLPANLQGIQTTKLQFTFEPGTIDVTDWHGKSIGSVQTVIAHCKSIANGAHAFTLLSPNDYESIEKVYPPKVIGASINLKYSGRNSGYVVDVKEQCVDLDGPIYNPKEHAYMAIHAYSTSPHFGINELRTDTLE